MVVVAGIDSVPLPPIVPPLQVMAAPVRLIAAEPFSVPPYMARVGIVCVAALFTVKVPPETPRGVDMVPETVLVPDCHWTVPAPEMVDAASNVRVSLVLKFIAVLAATLNVAPVLVTAR